MPRYVILKHETPAGYERPTHWDLMLERDDMLVTWALPEVPAAGKTMAAERLADHRFAYLDYEGPVSGDRGTVSRTSAGEYAVTLESGMQIKVCLDGRKSGGELLLAEFSKVAKGWRVTFSIPSPADTMN